MQRMTISRIEFKFDAKKDRIEQTIILPEDSKIKFVQAKYKKAILMVFFMHESQNSTHKVMRQKFHFVISKLKGGNIRLDEHIHIGDIDANTNTYSVFYQAGPMVP